MLFSMPRIIQHSYNFFSSRIPKPKLRNFSSRTPNAKLLTAKLEVLEGTETNPRPRIRPQGNKSLNRHKYHLLRQQIIVEPLYKKKIWPIIFCSQKAGWEMLSASTNEPFSQTHWFGKKQNILMKICNRLFLLDIRIT